MKTAVAIKRGYYIIDAHAWVDQRVGPRDDVLTASLQEFTALDVFDEYRPGMDTAARMQLWCAARDWTTCEGSPLYHDQGCLSGPVTVVLATGPQPGGGAYALVQVDDDLPVVYPDRTTDEGYWCRVRAVDICCPDGHRWTWLDDTSLLDQTGHDTTIAAVFGPGRQAPFRRCRDCTAFDNGQTDDMCDCGDPAAIYCPTCDQRCHLTLTDIATLADTSEMSR